jgi:hypothetical protein
VLIVICRLFLWSDVSSLNVRQTAVAVLNHFERASYSIARTCHRTRVFGQAVTASVMIIHVMSHGRQTYAKIPKYLITRTDDRRVYAVLKLTNGIGL